MKHFLKETDLGPHELSEVFSLARAFKRARGSHPGTELSGQTWALIFAKSSTRTRVSFEVGINELGGHALYLNKHDIQLGRGETIEDTARVLSRYVDAIMIRTDRPTKLAELAAHATVPVINGLTDTSHPCQVLADVMTFEEHRGSIEEKIVAWSGDGNNVAASWIQAAAHFRFEMRLACPAELMPPPSVVDEARGRGARIKLTIDPVDAVTGADCVLTDTWLSMGFREENRQALLAPYQVNEALMAHAKPEAVFMHCLPAHRGEEVTAGVIDGPQSVVWDEAENRLHVQKGVLLWCLR